MMLVFRVICIVIGMLYLQVLFRIESLVLRILGRVFKKLFSFIFLGFVKREFFIMFFCFEIEQVFILFKFIFLYLFMVMFFFVEDVVVILLMVYFCCFGQMDVFLLQCVLVFIKKTYLIFFSYFMVKGNDVIMFLIVVVKQGVVEGFKFIFGSCFCCVFNVGVIVIFVFCTDIRQSILEKFYQVILILFDQFKVFYFRVFL